MIENGVIRNPSAHPSSPTPPTTTSEEITARFEELTAAITELAHKVDE